MRPPWVSMHAAPLRSLSMSSSGIAARRGRMSLLSRRRRLRDLAEESCTLRQVAVDGNNKLENQRVGKISNNGQGKFMNFEDYDHFV